MLEDHPPRHFCDLSVPSRADGTPINRDATGEDYTIYVHWLADHLYETDLPLHPRQLAWALESDNREPSHGIFKISEEASFGLWNLEYVEQAFADGGTWEDEMAEARRTWEAAWPSPEDHEDHPVEEYLITRNVWDRIGEEWMEKPVYHHADIPYRSLLARLLKRIPDRERRIWEIDSFFRNFFDNLAK